MRKTLIPLVLPLALMASAHGALVYVDALGGAGGNTTNATTGSATDWYVVGTGAINSLWDLRTTGAGAIGYGGNAYQLNLADGSLAIKTTITGLQANSTYTGIRLYYVGNANTTATAAWNIAASVVSGTDGFVTYTDNSGNPLIDSSTDALGTADTGTPATDTRYWVSLGDVTTDSSGSFSVWVNLASTTNDRAVYDGIAYDNVAVPETSASVLLGVGALLGCSRRRRG